MSNEMSSLNKRKGKVKWFSMEKGYGYINDKSKQDITKQDLYFGVKDVVGFELPEHGDIVEYEEYVGREDVTAARDIIIIEKANPDFKKIYCESCKKDVIPKHWHFGGTDYTNMKTAYLCPHCGSSIYESGGGFNKLAKYILIFIAAALSVITFIITK